MPLKDEKHGQLRDRGIREKQPTCIKAGALLGSCRMHLSVMLRWMTVRNSDMETEQGDRQCGVASKGQPGPRNSPVHLRRAVRGSAGGGAIRLVSSYIASKLEAKKWQVQR